MLAIILLSLVLSVTLSAFLFRRNTTAFLQLLTCILFLCISSGLLPKMLLQELQVHALNDRPTWGDKNLIIVLGLATVQSPYHAPRSQTLSYARIYETARLYFNCKKNLKICHVLVSGGDPDKKGIAEADVLSTELQNLNILKSDIIVENKSNNTFENAKFSAEAITKMPWDQVYLVTSGTHMSRSLLYFGHFGVKASPSPADRLETSISYLPRTTNFLYTELALHEFFGMLRFHFYNKIGRN